MNFCGEGTAPDIDCPPQGLWAEQSFLQRGAQTAQPLAAQPAALARLQAYHWPGNVRELRHVLERARLFADDGVVRPEHLPAWVSAPLVAASPRVAQAPGAATAGPDVDAEIARLLAEGRLGRREMAAQLGLSERTLYRRLKATSPE